jgi:hypothetical protein
MIKEFETAIDAAYLRIFVSALTHASVRHRPWPVGRRPAHKPQRVDRARRHQTRARAADRLRPVPRHQPQPAQHHRRRHLRRRADRPDEFILAGTYKVDEDLVASTVSITTLLSVVTLMGWLYALSGLGVWVRADLSPSYYSPIDRSSP